MDITFPGRDPAFRLRIFALLDLYTVLGLASRHLQDVQQLPWERQARYQELLDKLRRMNGTLPSEGRVPSVLRTPEDIQRAVQEIEDPAEMVELWPNLGKHTADLNTNLVRIPNSQKR